MANVTVPRVYVDFQNADMQGRVRLNCAGTREDLDRQGVILREGLVLDLYSDDTDDRGERDELRASGTVQFSNDEQDWVALIDWAALHHAGKGEDPAAGRKAG